MEFSPVQDDASIAYPGWPWAAGLSSPGGSIRPRGHRLATRPGAAPLPATIIGILSDGVRQNPERHLLRGHAGEVHSLVYGPDGRTTTSASVDKTVRLWLSSPGAGWLALACQQLGDHRSLMAPVNNVQRQAKSTCERWG